MPSDSELNTRGWLLVEGVFARLQHCSGCSQFRAGGGHRDEAPWIACMVLERSSTPFDCPEVTRDDAIESLQQESDE